MDSSGGDGSLGVSGVPEMADAPTQFTFESTMAVCLHKILTSSDYLAVINYSR